LASDLPPPPRPARLVTAALLVGVLFGYARLWGRCVESPSVDFYQFWLVGRAARLQPGLDPYSDQGRHALAAAGLSGVRDSPALRAVVAYRRELETYSSPLLYATFGAAATTSYDGDRLLFQALSMAAFVGGLLLVARAFELSLLARLVLLVFALEWNEPVFADASVGNVGRLQVGLLGVCFALVGWRSRARPALLGALLAGIVLFKPTLALVPLWLLLLWLLRRRYGDVALALAGGAAAVVVAIFWAARGGFPWPLWGRWLAAASAMPEATIPFALGNLGLARALGAGLGVDVAPALAIGLSALVMVLLLRGPAAGEEPLVLALAALSSLLAARLVWIHYYVLALPAVAACLRASARPIASGTAVAALALFAVRPLFTVLGRVDLTLEAVLLDAATLALFAAIASGLAGPRPSARASIPSNLEATG
jgi:hypothetical protein